MPTEIYLDSNATTPVLPAAVAAACLTMQQQFGNPSSSHSSGLLAQALRESVRRNAAELVGAGTGRIVFVSGATEGIQTAALSSACAHCASDARKATCARRCWSTARRNTRPCPRVWRTGTSCSD